MSLEPVTRPNGKVYRPRKVAAYPVSDDDYDALTGVVVLGTHDVGLAGALGAQAAAYWADEPVAVVNPAVGWYRLGYSWGELTWLHDEVTGRAGVMFRVTEP